jgi:hypothetical protein
MKGNKISSTRLLMEGLHYFDSYQTGLFLISTGKPHQNTIFEFFGS